MQRRTTLSEILKKIQSYCAARERCHSEVRSKLLGLHVYGDDLEEMISTLVAEGFLNEERFARSYARGKFRMNGWGRTKILYALKGKKVSQYCIDKGLQEIDEEEYTDYIDTQLRKLLKGSVAFEVKQKAIASLQRKGFEYPLIRERLEKIK